MKIDPTNILGTAATPASTGAARPEDVRNANKTPVDALQPADSKDQVQLSALLDRLKNAGSSGQSDSELTPERAAHLDKLAAAVGDGSYEVDAKKLSSKIVDDHLRGIG